MRRKKKKRKIRKKVPLRSCQVLELKDLHTFRNFHLNYYLSFRQILQKLIPRKHLWTTRRFYFHKKWFTVKFTIFWNLVLLRFKMNFLFKVNNRNISEICTKLTIKIPWRRSGIFIVNFEQISHLFLVFLLLNLNK